MILDVVLLLSSWSGKLDAGQYLLTEHESLILPLECAFSSVLAETPMENEDQWWVMMNSSFCCRWYCLSVLCV